MLESMDQDTTIIPAPKYSAILENLAPITCTTALGVEWSSYEIIPEDCTAHIYWSTTQEHNNSHFLLERSQNGQSFETIARIEGANNSYITQHYQYFDEPLLSGDYYYRIKQIDMNGSIHILGTRTVQLDCTQSNWIAIFPNPVHEHLTISVLENMEASTMEIFNINGQIVWQQASSSHKGGLQQVDLSTLPSGLYTLTILKNGQLLSSQRFVKN